MFVYVAHNITTVATDKYGKTSHIIGPGLTKNIKKISIQFTFSTLMKCARDL